ncbi:hypothetical protein GCM10027202_02250 [Microvirgula curvata]
METGGSESPLTLSGLACGAPVVVAKARGDRGGSRWPAAETAGGRIPLSGILNAVSDSELKVPDS